MVGLCRWRRKQWLSRRSDDAAPGVSPAHARLDSCSSAFLPSSAAVDPKRLANRRRVLAMSDNPSPRSARGGDPAGARDLHHDYSCAGAWLRAVGLRSALRFPILREVVGAKKLHLFGFAAETRSRPIRRPLRKRGPPSPEPFSNASFHVPNPVSFSSLRTPVPSLVKIGLLACSCSRTYRTSRFALVRSNRDEEDPIVGGLAEQDAETIVGRRGVRRVPENMWKLHVTPAFSTYQ